MDLARKPKAAGEQLFGRRIRFLRCTVTARRSFALFEFSFVPSLVRRPATARRQVSDVIALGRPERRRELTRRRKKENGKTVPRLRRGHDASCRPGPPLPPRRGTGAASRPEQLNDGPGRAHAGGNHRRTRRIPGNFTVRRRRRFPAPGRRGERRLARSLHARARVIAPPSKHDSNIAGIARIVFCPERGIRFVHVRRIRRA